MSFTDKVVNALLTVRQTGQTTVCVGALLQNQKAKMVVGTFGMKRLVTQDHPFLDDDRVITVEELPRALHGFSGPLLFDNTAVVELLTRVRTERLDTGLDMK
jgi:hypothetical protein